jgi:predicted transcriptional regulator
MEIETKMVSVSLPKDVYEQMEEFAIMVKASESDIMSEALKQYMASEKRWQNIRKRGEETAKAFGIKNEDDVDKLIHDFRREKSKCIK